MSAGQERDALLRKASKDARLLERENLPWSIALAHMIRAGLAATGGVAEAAVEHYAAAAEIFESNGLGLYANAARYRQGELGGGDEGRALVDQAHGWMLEQTVKNPGRMMAMLAPGPA